MKIFATSAQIAEEYEIDHDLVIEAAISLPYSDDFIDSNIQIFEVSGIKIAQVTGAGYGAILFHIDCYSHKLIKDVVETSLNSASQTSGCEKILQWREKFFYNNALILEDNSNSSVSSQPNQPNNRIKTRSTISKSILRQAEESISTGKYDNYIDYAYTEIHKLVMQDMGTDPGYQNIIQYVKARRIALGAIRD